MGSRFLRCYGCPRGLRRYRFGRQERRAWSVLAACGGGLPIALRQSIDGSRRPLSASNLAELGGIASGHATDIWPEIFVTFNGGSLTRNQMRAQPPGEQREPQ